MFMYIVLTYGLNIDYMLSLSVSVSASCVLQQGGICLQALVAVLGDYD